MSKNQHYIRAFRISLAMLISFIYVKITNVSEGVWVLMTCAILLFDNSTIGGALVKGYYRIVGTFLAVIYSAVVIFIYANSTIANLIAIILSVFFAAFYYMDTKKSYIGGMIAWTTPILLLNNNNLNLIFIRPLNIMVGIIISYTVQRMFFPEYAKNSIMLLFSEWIDKTRELLLAVNTCNNKNELKLTREKIENELIANINKIHRMIDEAAYELRKGSSYINACNNLMLNLRRLLKFTVVFVHQIEEEVIGVNNNIAEITADLAKILDLFYEAINNNIDVHNLNTDFDNILDIIKTLEEKISGGMISKQEPILKMVLHEFERTQKSISEVFVQRKLEKIYK